MSLREKELLPVAAPLRLLLATPRGFCAGVARAIDALGQRLLVEEQGPMREDTTCKIPSLDRLA